MLPPRLSFKPFVEPTLTLVFSFMGIFGGGPFIYAGINIFNENPWHGLFALLLAAIFIGLFVIGVLINFIKKEISVGVTDFVIEFKVGPWVMRRKLLPKSDYITVYSPSLAPDRLKSTFTEMQLSDVDQDECVDESIDMSGYWLLHKLNYNKRQLLCKGYHLYDMSQDAGYTSSRHFAKDFFKLPVVGDYQQYIALSDTVAGAAKPAGAFKLSQKDGELKLTNHLGLYAGVFLSIIFGGVVVFGAVPPNGLVFVLMGIILATYREEIALGAVRFASETRLLGFVLARREFHFTDIVNIKTYPGFMVGDESAVVEITLKSGEKIGFPTGQFNSIGAVAGLSRLNMEETIWLVRQFKSRMPTDIQVIDEGGVWE